jgi:valyl-tRNA synthetase
MRNLPKAYNPKETEQRIYKLWEKSGFFNPDKLPKKPAKTYTLFLPPPNITGSLHMGHALNAVIQDALIRKKRMEGFGTLWVPGTDHAGIATQNVVEKKLKKEGRTRFDLGREKFVREIWKWKDEYGNIILKQLKKLGASCDWSRTVFTMDKNYARAVQEAFLHYWEKGLIYLGKRPINWCSRCKTSLSDLELEYKEEKGKLYYIKYPLKSEGKKGKFITVATTRPETMLGDTAVAVNPSDKRYKKLVGQLAILPILEKEIPIIKDKIVDPKFGTGAVKITPAHDLKDYEVGIRHKLEIVSVIDENGRMGGKAPRKYQGLKTKQARELIVEDLKKLGFLAKEEDYLTAVPKCYRCSTTIEIIPSEQWFLKMNELAKNAKDAVKQGKIRFYPKNFEKIYFEWLNNIRDWCISRQIWWGHRLPVWKCSKKKNPGQESKYFVSLEKPKKCPFCKKCKPSQVEDVLDTWFSSALWPFATLNWPLDCYKKNPCQPKKDSDLQRFYPGEVLVTARDIINLWVARMVFSGIEFMGKIPFYSVFIHPTVLTKSGQRMSKSLGTGIDPIEMIEKYGADATRFGLSWQLTGLQDVRFGEDDIIMGKKFCNKIWNASRFALMQVGSAKIDPSISRSRAKLTSADKAILKELNKTISSVEKDMERFRFGQAAQTLYHFFWHKFCDIYIEKAKIQLSKAKSEKEKERTKKVLLYVLLAALKLLHPFVPFITEEIYQKLPLKEKKKCLMVESWPKKISLK